MERGRRRDGFTLIELSIVLVIIGLIVGGILVGRDLVRAAAVRAQISQIEKYQTAVNTFREKYGYLPGDMNAASASQFGFIARGQYAGQGDGDGVIEGMSSNAPNSNKGFFEDGGETLVFWVDLSQAKLIDGNFNTASETVTPNGGSPVSGTGLKAYFPAAKLGQENYIYVYSKTGVNYFAISAITSIQGGGLPFSTPALTVQQAFGIDTKIDDGYPQTGNVVAQYLNSALGNNYAWAISQSGGALNGPSSTTATTGAFTTCYDNANSAGAKQQYSVQQNGGAGVNCALSFRFQ